MKVILDCNVLVSAGLGGQVCLDVFNYTLENTDIFISPTIMEEYLDVLQRKKFSGRHLEMRTLLRSIYAAGKLMAEPPTASAQSPDPKDQPYIDLALAVQADYLITGNMQDFPDPPYGITQVIKPADFLRLVV